MPAVFGINGASFRDWQGAVARIRLKQDDELSPEVLEQVRAVEQMGGDTSTMRGLAHRQSLFDGFFQWYGKARRGEAVEEERCASEPHGHSTEAPGAPVGENGTTLSGQVLGERVLIKGRLEVQLAADPHAPGEGRYIG